VGGGAAAGALVLGACGGGDKRSTATTTTSDAGSLALAQFFGGPMFVAGREIRAPFGVGDQDGLLPVDRTPKRLTVELLNPDGAPHGDPIEVERRSTGLPRAYFPLLATFDQPGIYTARTEIDGQAAEMSLKVDAPADVKVVQVGAPMPALDTPTVADARGVSPICTREPACPLHDVTVAEALGADAPFALLVASPAFCQKVSASARASSQTSICGPVLDVLLAVREARPDLRMLHAEVFADPAKDQQTYAPVVTGLGLHFEPCLVLVGADSTVVDRIDTIYDESELGERLAQLA